MMGEAFGIPEWLAVLLWIALALSLYFGLGFASFRRARRRLARRRPDPTRDEFLQSMAADVQASTAQWLWDRLRDYYEPMRPHPEDLLVDDAMLDPDDIATDFPRDFAREHGLDEAMFTAWQDGEQLTPRSLGRWLDAALVGRADGERA